jgi:outer membrane protein assembly factor BamB
MRANWGTAASPALHGDRLYIINDNEEQSFLEALDKRTGETVWQVERDEKSNWSTPFVWENEQRTEIITPGSGKTRAYDLEGKVLYEFGGASSITIATPYAAHGLLYVSSGYILDPRKPLFAVRPGASGDITLGGDETTNAGVAWCQKSAAPYNPSTIVYGDLLYVLLDRGFVACYDAKTGEQKYAPQRLSGGQAYTASPWAYHGKVFFLSEYGQTAVVVAGPEFKLLHTNMLADDDMCMATPALAGGRLLIRAERRLYCIRGLGVKAEAAAR